MGQKHNVHLPFLSQQSAEFPDLSVYLADHVPARTVPATDLIDAFGLGIAGNHLSLNHHVKLSDRIQHQRLELVALGAQRIDRLLHLLHCLGYRKQGNVLPVCDGLRPVLGSYKHRVREQAP